MPQGQLPTKPNPPVPIVIFGVDGDGKPKAARFLEKHAELAAKAAAQMQLQVLAVTDAKIAEVAAQLPAGRIHANGRGLVPYIRRDLYAKLMAAARPTAPDQPGPQSPPGGAGSAGHPSNPTGIAPNLPRDWDEIGPGQVVVVQETLEDGWYEALVFARTDDMLTVRWRDYPRDRKFMRHRLTVALMYPNNQTSPAASQRQGASRSSSGDHSFPQTWDEIDINHLVLAKQEGPWGGWWEAVPIENHGDHLTLRWRDYPKLPTFVRSCRSLALLCPKP